MFWLILSNSRFNNINANIVNKFKEIWTNSRILYSFIIEFRFKNIVKKGEAMFTILEERSHVHYLMLCFQEFK